MNTPVRSVVDLTSVGDLAKVNGDLGRVAGLLKSVARREARSGAKTDGRRNYDERLPQAPKCSPRSYVSYHEMSAQLASNRTSGLETYVKISRNVCDVSRGSISFSLAI